MKVRHYLPEVGFVKVPRDDKGSIKVFVNVAVEHIVKFRLSQASVCLWWNVNSINNDRILTCLFPIECKECNFHYQFKVHCFNFASQ